MTTASQLTAPRALPTAVEVQCLPGPGTGARVTLVRPLLQESCLLVHLLAEPSPQLPDPLQTHRLRGQKSTFPSCGHSLCEYTASPPLCALFIRLMRILISFARSIFTGRGRGATGKALFPNYRQLSQAECRCRSHRRSEWPSQAGGRRASLREGVKGGEALTGPSCGRS